MRAEVISVGTEILLGQITDTNSTFISRRLAELGIDVYFKTTVGDNEQRMLEVLEIAAKRSDLIIISGGLGPTADDLTKKTVAKFLGQKLALDQAALASITAYYQANHKVMTENNKVQAMYLEDSEAIPNHAGMAVGNFYSNPNGPDYILLPGPPSEMRPMFTDEIMPRLKQRVDHLLFSRVLRFYGIGESQLVTDLRDLIEEQTNPTLAPYAKVGEVTLRLTAQAKTKDQADNLLDTLEAKIKARVGQYFYGYGDDNSLAEVVVSKLKEQHKKVAASESLTGGLFQATITSISGASNVFDGGFVTYAAQAKASLLHIPQNIIADNGVVSEITAQWMAKQTLKLMNADFALSFTGVAGPDSLEGNPAGTVWIGLAQKDGSVSTKLCHFYGDRAEIRTKTVLEGLNLLNQSLNKGKL